MRFKLLERESGGKVVQARKDSIFRTVREPGRVMKHTAEPQAQLYASYDRCLPTHMSRVEVLFVIRSLARSLQPPPPTSLQSLDRVCLGIVFQLCDQSVGLPPPIKLPPSPPCPLPVHLSNGKNTHNRSRVVAASNNDNDNMGTALPAGVSGV